MYSHKAIIYYAIQNTNKIQVLHIRIQTIFSSLPLSEIPRNVPARPSINVETCFFAIDSPLKYYKTDEARFFIVN